MKKIILFFVLFSFSLNAGTISSNIDQNTIKINYNDNTNLFRSENKLTAVAYFFDNENSYPNAIEIPLNLIGKNNYEGSYYVLQSTPNKVLLFALIKVGNKEYFDTKNFEYNELIFLDSLNKPKKNTYYKLGLTYFGSVAPSIKRAVDLKKASEYFDKELSLFPENVYAKIAKNSLKYEINTEKDEAYYNFLSSLVRNFEIDKADDYSALNAIRIYKAIGKDEQANKIQELYTQKNPKSEVADQLEFDKLKKIQSQKKFNNSIINFLKDFPKSQNFEKAYFALMDSYIMTDNFAEFAEITKNLPGINANIITKVLNKLENKLNGLELIKYIYYNFELFKENKASYLTTSEYDSQIKIQKLLIAQSIIENFYKVIDDTLRNNLFSNDFLPIASIANDKFLDEFIDYYKSKVSYKQIFDMIEEMISVYSNNDKLIDLHKEYYRLLNYDIQNYQKYFDKLIASKRSNLFKSLKFESYNNDLNDAIVQNKDNELINLKFYKGKILLIEFWSTWLSSSELILKSVDSILTSSNMNDEVVFLPVSVWEKDKDIKNAITKYLEEHNFTQQVYIDNDNSIPYNVGITGLPARIFIDKSGKIRFIENGFTDIDSYIENLKLKIDYLKNE